MPSLKDVRQKYQDNQSQKLSITPYRYAFLGDGRGYAASNMYVPGDSGSTTLWARSTPQDARFFPILNRNAVVPQFNLPVVIGYKQDEPRTEQVLGIHAGGLGNISASNVSILGPHHHQHEFGGGDDVHIDGILFKPGLVTPTSPASMQLTVLPFIYFYNTWSQFAGGNTASLATFLPPTGRAVYVLIALDPTTNSLVYRPGSPFISPGPPFNFTTFSFARVPAPAGNEFPLGYAILVSSTTSLDWQAINNAIGDARLHVNPPMLNILDRLRQLEGYSGNEPSIATTGAGASTVSDLDRTLGGLTNVNVSGALNAQALIFDTATNRWIPGNPAAAGGLVVDPTGPIDTGSASTVGVSASAAHGDHVHRGVQSVNVPGNALLYGPVRIESGTGTTVAQSGTSILISASGGGGGPSVSSIMVAGASPLQGNVFLLAGTGASLSQNGGSITIVGTGAALGTVTPAGIGTSPTAGTSASAAPSDHIHNGILSVLAGNGASVEISAAGCATISMAGSGWASAIQLANRSTNVTYANGSLTRIFTAAYAASTTVLAQADLQLKTGATSPPTNIVDEFQMSGVADAEKFGLTGVVLPNEFYTVIDNSQAGASINLYKWTEYDDYGGAPAPAIVNRVFNGRLTNDGSNAIPSVDTVGTSAIWYVPYVGNQVSLYTPASVWNTITFNAASLNISSLSPNSNYDIWGYQNSAELSLLSTRWNVNDIARVNATSAQDGIQAEASNRTRALLGTIRITGTSGQTEDSLVRRFVWNQHNRVRREMYTGNVSGHTYGTAAWRNYNNSTASAKIEFIIGNLYDTSIPSTLLMSIASASANAYLALGVGGATPPGAGYYGTALVPVGGDRGNATIQSPRFSTPGYHYIIGMQYGSTNASYSNMYLEGQISS
jgi:hypothetical protein